MFSFGGKLTALVRFPYLYASGADQQYGSGMRSPAVQIALANGTAVCPAGYILQLHAGNGGSVTTPAVSGACVQCGPGTYSLLPLAGYLPGVPSCMKCLLGCTCPGGNQVRNRCNHACSGIHVLSFSSVDKPTFRHLNVFGALLLLLKLRKF